MAGRCVQPFGTWCSAATTTEVPQQSRHDEARRQARYNLASVSYTVTATTAAENGEHHLATSTFDLFTLDWMLSDMSGIELCRLLQLTASNSESVPQ